MIYVIRVIGSMIKALWKSCLNQINHTNHSSDNCLLPAQADCAVPPGHWHLKKSAHGGRVGIQFPKSQRDEMLVAGDPFGKLRAGSVTGKIADTQQ